MVYVMQIFKLMLFVNRVVVNKNLSKEFGIDIGIGDEEWSDLFDELVYKYIELDDE